MCVGRGAAARRRAGRFCLTCPTGAGKTTALQALAELDAHIIDADAVYHALLESSATLRAELTARFGPSILDGEGRVNRKALGGVVFGDPAALAELNAITHRFILAEIDRQAAGAEEQGRSAVAIDAIALIESGLGETCGAIVGILAPRELRIRRIMAREGISEDYARKRVEAQQGDGFFRTHCDYLLENRADDTPEAFQARAKQLFEQILSNRN